MTINEINTNQIMQYIEEGAALTIIDVRSKEEYATGHVHIAKLIPMDTITAKVIDDLKLDKDQPLYFICRSGKRSEFVAKMFAEQGFELVYNIVGGTEDWIDKGFPIAKGA